jgi:GNAT superfamily N-acetyltransferase
MACETHASRAQRAEAFDPAFAAGATRLVDVGDDHVSTRFAALLRGPKGELAGGVVGAMSWSWLFIEAMWIRDDLKGQGLGRALMATAEAHAVAQGCHSAWLDTFQAQDFYLALSYEPFGVLEDYPPGQRRTFMRKRLAS